MSNVKLAVIFYSIGGTNHQLAKWAQEGAQADGAEVKLLKVQELAPESTIESNVMHWGAIIATPGYTDPVIFGAGGNPYGTSVTVDQNGKMIEDVEAAVKHQAKRTVTVAEWVKKGSQ